MFQVFEVFGPVSSPLYVLRFNSVDQISSKGLTEGLTVYYAPAIKEYTGYILTQQLKLYVQTHRRVNSIEHIKDGQIHSLVVYLVNY